MPLCPAFGAQLCLLPSPASAHCIPVLLQRSPIHSVTTVPSVTMSHPQMTFLAVGETLGPNQG